MALTPSVKWASLVLWAKYPPRALSGPETLNPKPCRGSVGGFDFLTVQVFQIENQTHSPQCQNLCQRCVGSSSTPGKFRFRILFSASSVSKDITKFFCKIKRTCVLGFIVMQNQVQEDKKSRLQTELDGGLFYLESRVLWVVPINNVVAAEPKT